MLWVVPFEKEKKLCEGWTGTQTLPSSVLCQLSPSVLCQFWSQTGLGCLPNDRHGQKMPCKRYPVCCSPPLPLAPSSLTCPSPPGALLTGNEFGLNIGSTSMQRGESEPPKSPRPSTRVTDSRSHGNHGHSVFFCFGSNSTHHSLTIRVLPSNECFQIMSLLPTQRLTLPGLELEGMVLVSAGSVSTMTCSGPIFHMSEI